MLTLRLRLGLARQIGHDPYLVGLLRVFKNYYPEVIVGNATRGRASPFKVGHITGELAGNYRGEAAL